MAPGPVSFGRCFSSCPWLVPEDGRAVLCHPRNVQRETLQLVQRVPPPPPAAPLCLSFLVDAV
ncbi:hypothetical protein CCHR01_19082 [Colletotrichum chrysophilum]|uniref:Uncharacterized protein n=1 Tax=Colletotrichum chrysophilum TaxID=1836956 RepID=A0AAD9E842_9PEZI|nr:hypothetical protein CCHR01_19082 [Colletotrichum chrysophilum]